MTILKSVLQYAILYILVEIKTQNTVIRHVRENPLKGMTSLLSHYSMFTVDDYNRNDTSERSGANLCISNKTNIILIKTFISAEIRYLFGNI